MPVFAHSAATEHAPTSPRQVLRTARYPMSVQRSRLSVLKRGIEEENEPWGGVFEVS